MTTNDAAEILAQILSQKPRLTSEAPDDQRGVYGLINHLGTLSYIGCTQSSNETLKKRIHARHRTGSETESHYFSKMYNTGRMWRDRRLQRGEQDAQLAKCLRNAFIAEHCRAVWVAISDGVSIMSLEKQVIALAPPEATAWNNRRAVVYDEPRELVDLTIERLRFGPTEIAALERQEKRYLDPTSALAILAMTPCAKCGSLERRPRGNCAACHKEAGRAYLERRNAAIGSHSAAEWREKAETYTRCPVCQRTWDEVARPAGQRLPYTKGHIVPLTRGGSNSLDNLQPECASCNYARHGARFR